MRKLKTLDLCGIKYKIIYHKPAKRNTKRKGLPATCIGQIDNDRRTIRLEGERGDIGYVLFHELIHGTIESIYPDPNDKVYIKFYSEPFVRPFARIFWSMLKSAGMIKEEFL